MFGLFQKVLDDNNQSYNVQQQAAIGIGKMADGNTFNLLKRHLETESFQNLVAQGAITGLRIFGTRATDPEIITQIITLLIDKCGYGNYDNIIASAVSALSFFISDKNGNIENPGYDHVVELLHHF